MCSFTAVASFVLDSARRRSRASTFKAVNQIVECVPNFSEGRDLAKIKQITDAIEAVSGVSLLDVDAGADANRTVVTFVGPPEAVLEAAFNAVQTASEVLDMSTHSGSHPRMGATDVCPFIPVEGITIEECAKLAARLGERVGQELNIPVYLYEAAASTPARRNLAVVRKGEYEGLADKLLNPQWAPDYGPNVPHRKAGALITGSREFLIAYNVSLNTRDKSLATDIAFELREKGRVARKNSGVVYSTGEKIFYAEDSYPCGNCDLVATNYEELAEHTSQVHGYDLGELLALNDVPLDGLIGRSVYRAGRFSHCKAIGWIVDEYDRAQISINLTDYHITPPHLVLEEARRLASDRGLVVTGSEIVGLIPFQALYESGQYYLAKQGRTSGIPVDDVLATAVQSMGLNDTGSFDITKRVLGLPAMSGELVSRTVTDFTHEVSRCTPAPGGGSVAALAGALGAALASMVASLTEAKVTDPNRRELLDQTAVAAQQAKDALLCAVDNDTDAFTAYMVARRLPQRTPEERNRRGEAMQEGLKHAIWVPMETARTSLEAMKLCQVVVSNGLSSSLSDGAVGAQVAFAGVRGGIWNAQINLAEITDPEYTEMVRTECQQLLASARTILDELDQILVRSLG